LAAIDQQAGRDRPNKLVAIDQTAGRHRPNNWPRWTLHEGVGITRNIPYEVLSIGCKISIVRGTICYLFLGGWGRDVYEIRDTQDSVLRVDALLKS